jgi:hypothetical protein
VNWLVEHGLKSDGLWLIASFLTAFIFVYDERSWRGLAVHGLQHELQRFRLRLFPLVTLAVLLPWPVSQMGGLLVHVAVTAVSAATFQIYQHTAFACGGRPVNGATRRILLIFMAALIGAAILPGIPSVWIPLLFMTAATGSSLSARNYLILHINEESMALRQRLLSSRASAHNGRIVSANAPHPSLTADNADDNALKAG